MTGSAGGTSRAAVKDFLAMLAAERGAAKNTLDAYARDLGDYLLALARRKRDPFRATTNDIRDYLADLAGGRAQAVFLGAQIVRDPPVSSFSCRTEERRADDPAVLLEGPRQGRRLPKILSVEEVDAILRVCREGLDDPARPPEERLRARRAACLVEVLYASGLRVSELVALPLVGRETGRKNASAGRRLSDDQGQGRTRAAGAPHRRRRARRSPPIAASCLSFIPKRRNRNGCFPRSARAAI